MRLQVVNGCPSPVGVLRAMRQGDADAAEAAKRANIRSGAAYLKRYESFVL